MAFFYKKEKKYLRGIVESIRQPVPSNPELDIIVWALDYGFAIQVKDEYIRKLSKPFSDQTFTHVVKFGIACIMPAEEEIDFINLKPIFVMTKMWPECIVTQLAKLLDDSQSIEFSQELSKGDHQFGDLQVTLVNGDKRSVRQLLLCSSYVKIIDGPEFLPAVQKYNTTNFESWTNNRGHSIFQSYASDLHRVVESPSVRDVEVPAIAQLKVSYQKVDSWLEQNCTANTGLTETIQAPSTIDAEEQLKDIGGISGLDPPSGVDKKLPLPELSSSDDKEKLQSSSDDEEELPKGPILITNYQSKQKPEPVVNDMPSIEAPNPEKPTNSSPNQQQASKSKAIDSTKDKVHEILQRLKQKRVEVSQAKTSSKTEVIQKPTQNLENKKLSGLIPHDMAPVKLMADAVKNSKKAPRPPKAKPLPPPEPKPVKKPLPAKEVPKSSSATSKLDAIVAQMNLDKIVRQKREEPKQVCNEEANVENSQLHDTYKMLINNEEQLTFNWKVNARLHDDDG